MEIDARFIKSRIDRALESLDEAQLLLENGHYLTVVNRLYYAIFYCVTASLARHKLIGKTHTGIKSQFHQYFIKTGLVDEEIGKLYDTLFSDRNDSDYGDFETFDVQDIKHLLADTRSAVKKLIEFNT